MSGFGILADATAIPFPVMTESHCFRLPVQHGMCRSNGGSINLMASSGWIWESLRFAALDAPACAWSKAHETPFAVLVLVSITFCAAYTAIAGRSQFGNLPGYSSTA